MILVTLGTNEARFDRLVDAVDSLPRGERLVVQHGHSKRPAHPDATAAGFLPFDDLSALMREARAVVTHAGVGSVLVALAQGKRPVVVPRRHELGEAVDDHQLQLAGRFAAAGLVTCVHDGEELRQALGESQLVAPLAPEGGSLSRELREFVAASVDARAAAA